MMSLLSYLTMKKVSRMRKLALNALFFNVILDFVIADLTTRYTAANHINDLCSLLWQYRDLPDEILQAKAEKFIQIYSTDVSDELVTELKDLKSIHVPNFGIQPLSPIELLNRIYKSKLQSLFPNCCIALRICCTIPVTVAEAESSFSKLNLIKNFFTSMTQV